MTVCLCGSVYRDPAEHAAECLARPERAWESPTELAQLMVAGGAFTDEEALAVARAFLEAAHAGSRGFERAK